MNKYLSKLNNIPFSGAIGRPAALGTAIGAVGGAGVGAYNSEEGSRAKGALGGAAAGGLLGAGLGATKSYPNVRKLMLARSDRRAKREAISASIDKGIADTKKDMLAHNMFLASLGKRMPRDLENELLGPSVARVYSPPIVNGIPYTTMGSQGSVMFRREVERRGIHPKGPNSRYLARMSFEDDLSESYRAEAESIVDKAIRDYAARKAT